MKEKAMGEQVVVRPDQVETIMVEGTLSKVLCSPQLTGSQGLSAVTLFVEPGHGHARHNHDAAEQLIYVISGTGEHVIEDAEGNSRREPLAAGSLVYIPKGAFHSTFNTGWEPLRCLAMFSPPGPEVFLREVGDSGGAAGAAGMRVVPPGQVPRR